MAYSKAKTADIEKTQDSGTAETVPETVSATYVPRRKIPLDAQVMVKNLTGGKLIYVSKRLVGYSEEWHEFGEEIPMEMAELYSMKNTDRRFFTENWIEVDMAVLRDLQMDRFYENAITADEIENLFNMDQEELITKIKTISSVIKNCVGIKAMEMIKDGRLSNINTIAALEKALKCELYER